MATITLRASKGSPLTNAEVDANFTNINNELAGKLTANQTITLSGDVTGSGGTAITTTLANSGVAAGTYTKVTVDAKGRVTSGGSLASADLPTYTGSITSSQVTTALGYTPSLRGNFATNPEASVDAADIRNLTNPTTGLGYASGVRFRFSSLNDDSASPFADVIDLSTYGDATGGGVNALYLGKNSQVIQHKYAAAGGTAWTTKTVAYTDSNITGSAAKLTTGRTIGMTGDVTWTSASFDGSANVTGTATLANSGVSAGTYTKVTVDAKGRVTSGGSLASADLPTYTGSITSSQVTTALGYTPYNSTNPNGYTSNTGTVTSVGGTGTVSGLTLSGTVTTSGNLSLSGTLSASIDNLTDEHRLFNNMGDNHGTRSSFDAQGAASTVNFGWRYVQGATNGPGISGATQYYSEFVGLGNEHAYNVYGMQLAIPRVPLGGSPYLSVRFEEGGAFGAWQKINAGYADSAGTVSSITSSQVTTALGYTPYNSTNPNGYITSSGSITGSAATLTTGRTIGMTGDVTWTSGAFNGSANVTGTATLANSGVTAGTYTKVTVDAKGRVTSGGSLASADLPTYTGSITSSQVTTALGYTPYNSTNPAGYITSSGSITGNAATATAATYLNGGASSANQANITSRVNSGFWESDTGTMAEGWPVNSNTWQHLISSTHSNNDNYFALQLAAPFYDQALYYRSTNGSGTTAWSKVTLDTSVNRPGPTRLYRREEDSNYSVQTYWNGSHWVLDGYSGDTWHAGCRVAIANYADSAGSVSKLSTASGAAPSYSARAWVRFSVASGTPSVQGSGNVSSVSDLGTGYYRVNYTTAMPDTNYAFVGSAKTSDNTATSGNNTDVNPFSLLTTSTNMHTSDGGTLRDTTITCVAVFR